MPQNARLLKAGQDVILKGRPVQLSEVSIQKGGKHGHDKVLLAGKDVLTDESVSDWVSANSDRSISDVLTATVQRAPARVKCVNNESHVTIDTGATHHRADRISGLDGRRPLPAAPWIVEALLRLPNRGMGATVLVVTAPVISRWEYDRFTMGHGTGQGYHTSGPKMGMVAMETRVVAVALPPQTAAGERTAAS